MLDPLVSGVTALPSQEQTGEGGIRGHLGSYKAMEGKGPGSQSQEARRK